MKGGGLIKSNVLGKIIGFIKYITQKFITCCDNVSRFFKGGDFRKACYNENTYYWPFGLFLTNFILLLVRYLWCFYWVKPKIISVNPLYVIAFTLLPFIFFGMSTMCEKYNTHGWKKLFFWICIYNALLILLQFTWLGMYNLLVIRIMKIRITETMTEMMVVNLARTFLFISVSVPGFGVIMPLRKVFKDSNIEEMIADFKLEDVIDLRANKEVAYDISIMKDISGFGKKLPILEQDLFTHVMLVGPSGTGKTSTSINPAIIDLLDKKCKNRIKRTERLELMLKEGKAYVRGPVANPTEYDILPKPQYIKEMDKIYKEFPDCGITCVSPNDGIGDAVVKLCEAADVRVNMIDPEKHYDENCVRHIGINPFFIPDNLSEKEKVIRIITNANSFSEILLAVNDAAGAAGGDQYFKDLNTSVTSNIATIVMLYASIVQENATLGVIQRCINDFSLLYDMCVRINEEYRFGIDITNPKEVEKAKKSQKKAISNDFDSGDLDTSRLSENRNRALEYDEHYDVNKGLSGSSATNAIEALMKGAIDIYRPMRISVQYVNDDLFLNGDKMFDQSRGLRNILNNMISNPDVFEILNAQKDYIDFDNIFDSCEVTVVNSSVRIGGQKGSSALGLFYLLNFSNAVQRRRRDNNHPRLTQPHFLIVDEAAQYVHSFMSQAVNLWRQYKCVCLFAFQTLSQLERNAAYKDIKDSLLQVGNIIAYGRLGVNEMETFEKLSGTRNIVEFQESVSHSSILSEDPTASVGERKIHTEKSNVSASSSRLKRFKEATWFRYINGNVLPPLAVVLDFANLSIFDKKGYKENDWSQFYKDDGEFAEVIEESIEEEVKKKEPESVVETGVVLEQLHKGSDGELISECLVENNEKEEPVTDVEEKDGEISETVYQKDVIDKEDHTVAAIGADSEGDEDDNNEEDTFFVL